MAYPPVPFDPELALVFKSIPKAPAEISKDMLIALRSLPDPFFPPLEEVLAGLSVSIGREDITITGLDGVSTNLSIFRPELLHSSPGPKGCIYFIHGGGMVLGNHTVGTGVPISWAIENNAVVVSVEYRLAPEHPFPAGIEDCYSGLKWVSEHAAELGIDAEKIIIAGPSAGAGLSAGTALLARDRGGPKLLAQCLIYPMLDDRNESVSTHQYKAPLGTWSREMNLLAWKLYLGDKAGTDDVSIYAAPGRADNLSGLPQTFIDVGSAELFRDECVAYASKLWAAGVQCELYVVPGALHGYDGLAPDSQITVVANHVKNSWIKRVFERAGNV